MNDATPAPDAATVQAWREQGLTLAEIGHRLGLSAQALRARLAEQGVEIAPEPDDHRPNHAPDR